ncbi:carbohydrate ABC transporter permease [Endozoicomonas arenosclerae]|uniref:carbohydrate ABC transporter permease n=1 Tax=Endozoicomonas arenosclerae TaxID=1633495 RepID=UPI000780B7C8|nr:carbohydrate ABC transporter permease [Endozoicomonas arenosclerae]
MEKIFKLRPHEQLLVQFVLLAWALTILLPFGIALMNSVKPNLGAVLREPFALPEVWQFSNYARAWDRADFGEYFLNSMIISLSTVVISVLLATMVSFVLARHEFRGKSLIFICFMIGVIIPSRLALPPMFVVVKELGLANSLVGVILVQSAVMLPLAVFILTAFFKGVSPEIEQAARIDGGSPFQIYWMVVLPLVKPAIATVALLAFVFSWNEYILPLLFLQDRELYPLTLGMQQFKTQFAVQWHMMFAGLIIMMAPTVIAFLLASRAFIEGLTQGGVKE